MGELSINNLGQLLSENDFEIIGIFGYAWQDMPPDHVNCKNINHNTYKDGDENY